MSFPRFYFISTDDLLQILGSSEATSVQRFMLSLFDNCKKLLFGKGDKFMIGMTSDEGEEYEFETPVKPDGNVEDWMNKVDDEMKDTLHTITKKAAYHYAKTERIEWIKDREVSCQDFTSSRGEGKERGTIGMVAVVGTQIWWTFSVEDVFVRVSKGDKHAMKNELAKESQDLNDLIALVREKIGPNLRKAVNTLIILDVHARDIVDRFVRDSILSAKAFEWESQLRFYWDNNKNDIAIRQCTGVFDYCYEYQGLNGRLVITPLTDRCIMTLTTALTFKLGGSPAGPAGTGKTETVKDLAKSLAIRCVVTNCGETMDYLAVGIIFSGLTQTGFWGCFDEFNRINVEVLSVVSAQIKIIQNGLIFNKKKVELLGVDMRLIPSVGIFITMNPGYAGRSELPDNLKALFRPVTMVTPDLLLICENMLMSEGFTSAKALAKKMTVLYKLSKE
jgi:dynein heavy chain